MEKVNVMENTKIEEKKDLRPIGIYFIFQIAYGFIIGAVAGISKKPELLENYGISFIVPNTTLFFAMAIIYFKKIKEDIKRLTMKSRIFVILMSILTLSLVTVLYQYFLALLMYQ